MADTDQELETFLRELRPWIKIISFWVVFPLLAVAILFVERVPAGFWVSIILLLSASILWPGKAKTSLILFLAAMMGSMILVALGTNGVAAFTIFSPCAQAVFAGVVGGPELGIVAILIHEAIYGCFLYLHLTGAVYPHPQTVYGVHMPLWVLSVLFGVIVMPTLFNRLLKPLERIEEETKRRHQATNDLDSLTLRTQEALRRYSHDIRTPLNVIANVAEVINSGAEASKFPEIALLQSAAQQMLSVANNVLDCLAAEVGALQLELSTFDPKQVVQSVAASGKFAAQVKSMTFDVWFGPDVPSSVVADAARLQQLLRMLLSFLFQNVQVGSLTLEVTNEAISSNTSGKAMLKFKFTSLLPVQAVATQLLAKRLGTLRNGLSAVHILANALGGSLVILPPESQPPCFILTMPFAVPLLSPRQGGELRILYADDEPANHFVMRVLLKGTAHTLECVDNGRSAVEAYLQMQPDVVLLDQEMPIMAGLDAAADIRAREGAQHAAHTPIYMVTAHISPGFNDRAAQHGCNGVIAKPVEKSRLMTLFHEICRQRDQAGAVKLAEQLATLKAATKSNSADSVNAPSIRRVLRERFNLIWNAKELSLPLQLKYRASMVVIALNIVLLFASFIFPTALHDRAPFKSSFFAIAIGCLGVCPILLRYSRRALLAYTIVMQLAIAHYFVWYMQLTLTPMLPLMVPLLVGDSMMSSVIGGAIVIVHTLLATQFGGGGSMAGSDFAVLVDIITNMYLLGICGAFACYVLLSRQSSALRLAAEQLQLKEINARVVKRNQSLMEFVDSVSFDLRTPLNITLAAGERLRSIRGLEHRLHQHIAVVQSASALLLNLMRNMLDVNALQANALSAPVESATPIRSMIISVARMMRFHAHNKRVKVHLRAYACKRVPSYCVCDQVRMQQAIVNLVRNAVKYTEKGYVTMLVDTIASVKDLDKPFLETATDELAHAADYSTDTTDSLDDDVFPPGAQSDQANDHVARDEVVDSDKRLLRIAVVDTGPGIPEEVLHQLRNEVPSWSVDNTLGLQLTRAIVEQLGGVLVASNREGGATVRIAVPLLNADVKMEHALKDAEAGLQWQRAMRILIVDDVPEMLYILQMYLKDTPHHCDIAHTGEQAVELVRQHNYDVVILDMCLPAMQGTDVVKHIRYIEGAEARFASCHIMVLTALVLDGIRDRLLADGCDSFEAKPISRQRLLDCMNLISAERTPLGSPMTATTPTTSDELVSEVLASQTANLVLHQLPLANETWIARVPAGLFDYVNDTFMPQLRERVQKASALLYGPDGIKALRSEADSIKSGAETFGLTRVEHAARQLIVLCDGNAELETIEAAVEQMALNVRMAGLASDE